MPFSQAARGPVNAEILIWFEVKDRDTGLAQTLGFSTLDEDRTFEVEGEQRVYIGLGERVNVGNLISQTGVVVQTQRVSVSGLTEAANLLIKEFDARNAPAQIHSVQFDPETLQVIVIDDILKGFLNKAPESGSKKGGEPVFDLQFNTAARNLTRTLPLTQSHAYQQQFNNDEFMKYADVSGTTEVYWGQEKK